MKRIWVCYSTECEGTWIDDEGEGSNVCPNAECDNKNTTPYLLESDVVALIQERIDNHIEDDKGEKAYSKMWTGEIDELQSLLQSITNPKGDV